MIFAPVHNDNALAADIPILIPVNEPGPNDTKIKLISLKFKFAFVINSSIIRFNSCSILFGELRHFENVFLFFMIEILLFLIIVILIIWIYGFIRRNLGIDKQTKELEKIRKIMEKKFNE